MCWISNLSFIVVIRLASSEPAQTLLSAYSNMHENIHASTKTKHARNDAKAHEILWLVRCREQIRAIDLRKVAHSIDKRQRNSSDLRLHITKRRARKTKRQCVGRPQTSCH